jgi:hypothetical protein
MSRTLGRSARDALRRDPALAFHAIKEMREQLDEVEEAQVANALSQGWSWARIGRALGISRQAAHRKYSQRSPAPFRPAGTQLGKNVAVALVLARTEAAARGDALVGTEHLLLGLLQEGEGCAADALRASGVVLQDLRAALDSIAPAELSATKPSQLSLTRRAARAFEVAAGLARSTGTDHVSDEHLLRALLRSVASGARAALSAIGVQTESVERALDALTGHDANFFMTRSA